MRGLARGVPQIAFVRRGPRQDRELGVVSGGRLAPPRERDRIEILAPQPAQGAGAGVSPAPPSAPPVPPTAEESYSVPARYRILFEDGLSVEIRSSGEALNRGLLRRLVDVVTLWARDRADALGPGGSRRVRLRVELDAEDSARLYRSLPPALGLVAFIPAAP
jgi:hypothetical protein